VLVVEGVETENSSENRLAFQFFWVHQTQSMITPFIRNEKNSGFHQPPTNMLTCDHIYICEKYKPVLCNKSREPLLVHFHPYFHGTQANTAQHQTTLNQPNPN
jgi:hypothetical protein